MHVSLIATVLNEGESIRHLLDSIKAQTMPPDEIVICDGGSTDLTCAILDEYRARLPLTIIVEPGANISHGRNVAIAASRCPVIAVTDAGVRLDPEWLARITAPLRAESCGAAAGFFVPDPQTAFEVAMGATVLPEARDIDPTRFMPSSRSVAFRRTVFEAAGGYPEWLDYCEDLVFDFRVMRLMGRFEFVPTALVYFRPRSDIRAFMKQYFYYARGDGKAGLFFRRHLIRYLTYGVAVPSILIGAGLASPWLALLLPLGGLALVLKPYARLMRQWGALPVGGRLVAALWVPVIRVAGDLAKMAGYPAGLVWRLRHAPPDWRRP